jgi:hypothetical protein
MKLSQAFGDTSSLRIKSFVLAGKTFKVRVPLSKEMEDMQARIEIVDESKFQTRYEKAVKGLQGEEKDGDVYVDGRSTKELIRTAMQVENRIVEMFRLLVPIEGNLDDLTYEQIEEEMPFTVQLEMIKGIQEAIQPSYGDSRKNS